MRIGCSKKNLDWVCSIEPRNEGKDAVEESIVRRRKESNLRALFRNSVKDGLICAVRVAALRPGFLVVLIAFGKPFGSEVIGVAEGLVDTLQGVPASHEDLEL